jgi:hypothetical protein
MPDRLLDRQVKLLEHLTGAAAIFAADRGALLDGSLEGIDRGPLHLEARLSHEKRMVKIKSVLPRTLDLLGGKRAQIIREFVEACPPASINRLENARRFHGFLLARWEREAPEPAFLPDVASFELTYAAVRAGDRAAAAATETSGVLHAPHGAIRRHRNVAVLRCAHDIRPILEGRTDEASPARDETCFAVMKQPGTDEPLVSELSCDLCGILEMLDDFVDLDALVGRPDVSELIASLGARGLLEVHQ